MRGGEEKILLNGLDIKNVYICSVNKNNNDDEKTTHPFISKCIRIMLIRSRNGIYYPK